MRESITTADSRASSILVENGGWKPGVLLLVLDGWGHKDDRFGNAISLAYTPMFNRLGGGSPQALLEASGNAVGLPDGLMGNSEVGHLTIGLGRRLSQDIVRIDEAIKDRTFFDNPQLIHAFDHVKNTPNSTLHLWGLVSRGGVHSHMNHLYAMIEAAREYGVSDVAIHAVTDGRDVQPRSALQDINQLEKYLREINYGIIATISGRFFAMDRDGNTERTAKAVGAMINGQGEKFDSATDAIDSSYKKGITDEFIAPVVIGPSTVVKPDDTVIAFNFRTDRPRQTIKLLDTSVPKLYIVTMTQYNPGFPYPVVFNPQSTDNTLGEILAQHGIPQVRIAETEKWPHVTKFFDGQREVKFSDEKTILIPSNKGNTTGQIFTHSLMPEMRAEAIAEAVVYHLQENDYPFMIANFANADMVGHSGNIRATITGVETVDKALARIIPVARKKGVTIIVTADHGNAETMLDKSGEQLTAHTTNLVPFILLSPDGSIRKLARMEGDLTDIAPTILTLMGIPVPTEMTGKSFV